jgi:hypothetical protein
MVVDTVPAEVPGLVLHRSRILGVQILDGVAEAITLGLEERPKLCRIAAAH